MAVAAKVLPLGIFAHHLGIILIKFELIRYVVKEERLCGTTLNEGRITLRAHCIENNMERAMSNLAVTEVVGGLVNAK